MEAERQKIQEEGRGISGDDENIEEEKGWRKNDDEQKEGNNEPSDMRIEVKVKDEDDEVSRRKNDDEVKQEDEARKEDKLSFE